MMNLFSSFNPSYSYGNFAWSGSILYFSFLPMLKFTKISRVMSLLVSLWNQVSKEFWAASGKMVTFEILMFYASMFFLVLSWNFLGLLPYVFTWTSHLCLTLSLSMLSWVSSVSFNWIYFFNKTLAHLVPEGAPLSLGPFSVFIESISLIIRPLTLAVRLAANSVAGHLLSALLGGASMNLLGILPFLSSGVISSLFLVLETAVAMIQAYVISLLVSLYTAEVN